MIKIGIIGAGFIGQIHAEAFKSIKGVKVIAIAEKDLEKAKTFAQNFKIEKIYPDLSILEDNEIEVIDICLPTPLHFSTTIKAIKNNKHVLIEKPITLSIEEGEKILEESKKTDKIIMVAHVLRFWEEYVIIKDIIKKGIIGKIKEIFMYRMNELPLWSNSNWLLDSDKSGGIIVDLMIHDIDYVHWLLGFPKKISVSGIKNKNEFLTEALITLSFPQKVKAYLEGGYLHTQGTGLHSGIRVYGEKGSIYSSSLTQGIHIFKGDKKNFIGLQNINGYKKELEYFISCIKNNKKPTRISLEEAIKSLEIALKAKKILETKNGNNNFRFNQ